MRQLVKFWEALRRPASINRAGWHPSIPVLFRMDSHSARAVRHHLARAVWHLSANRVSRSSIPITQLLLNLIGFRIHPAHLNMGPSARPKLLQPDRLCLSSGMIPGVVAPPITCQAPAQWHSDCLDLVKSDARAPFWVWESSELPQQDSAHATDFVFSHFVSG